MKQLRDRIDQLRQYLSVFSTPMGTYQYRRLRYGAFYNLNRNLVAFRIRQLGGNKVFCRPGTTDSVVLWDTFYHQYHVPPITLSSDCVIVDLGANVGYTIAHFRYLYPNSRIIGVEMDKSNVELACRNIDDLNPKCELIHAAVWAEDGQINYGGESEWGFRVSLLDQNITNKTHSTTAKTLDSIFEDYGLTTVDYLKMDIEGSESYVLQPPMKWAERVRSIKVEIHPPATFEKCLSVLKLTGFKCKRDEHYSKCLVGVRQ